MGCRDRSTLDHPDQSGSLIIIELRGLPGRLAIDKTVSAIGVEPQNPVPNDLNRHAADPGSLRPRCAVIDRGKGKKPTSLGGVLRFAGNRTQQKRIKVTAQGNSHGEPPSFAIVNHITGDLKTARESEPMGLGIIDAAKHLGSGLIDYIQKMIVAAMQIAEKKV